MIALDEIDRNDNEEASDSSFTRHVVLIFLSGIYEIQELHNYLLLDYHEDKLWDLLILHLLISGDEQHLIFLKPPKDHRCIILSTNIAESSITVPDVKYELNRVRFATSLRQLRVLISLQRKKHPRGRKNHYQKRVCSQRETLLVTTLPIR